MVRRLVASVVVSVLVVLEGLTGALGPASDGRPSWAAGVPAPADHGDPLPPGVSLDDPIDTASIYRAAGLESGPRATAARTTPARAGTPPLPPGPPAIPGLLTHVQPSCSGTGTDGRRVQLLYVRERSQPSRLSELLPFFRHEAALVDDIYAVSSARTGGGRRVRWVHDDRCRPTVREVTVPDGTVRRGAGPLGLAVRAKHTRPDRKYVLLIDDRPPDGTSCGLAELYGDDSPTDNVHDGQVAMFAWVYAPCWASATWTGHSLIAHELTHTMGAVLGTAPNSTAYGHCTDESDLMCYADSSAAKVRTVCGDSPDALAWLLDCNGDDYFSTSEQAGSYLAGHWNVADSSFLDRVPPLSRPSATIAGPPLAGSGTASDYVAVTDAPSPVYSWRAPEECVEGATDQATFTLRCPAGMTGQVTVAVDVANAGGLARTVSATVDVATGAVQDSRDTTIWRSRLRHGEVARLRGRLTDSTGAALADATVAVLFRADGTSSWQTLGSAVTTADGRVAHTFTPVRYGVVRLRFSGSMAQMPSASEPIRVRLPTSLTAGKEGRRRLHATLVTSGGSPVYAAPVALQRRLPDGSWTRVALLRTDPGGRVERSVTPLTTTTYRFRYAGDVNRLRTTSGRLSVAP